MNVHQFIEPHRAVNKNKRHIVSIRNVETSFLEKVLDRAAEIDPREINDSLKGKSMIWIGNAPSTRTKLSFAAAIEDLGGNCRDLGEDSSMKGKHESFRDTIDVVGSYHDIIVIRSSEADLDEAAQYSSVSVVNAGNGTNEHPTQAMMTVFVLKQRFNKRIKGLKIALVGDLLRGRAAHSDELAIATHYPQNTIFRVAAPRLDMPEEIKRNSKLRGVRTHDVKDLGDVIREVDVVMLYRSQNEHKLSGLPPSKDEYPKLTTALADLAREDALFMHPLPRNHDVELPYQIDKYRQAVYKKDQLWAGPRVRKALLQELLLF